MARPHIEFIQSQALPWREDHWNGRFDGAAVKVLSEDDVTGAASTLVRYPAGWSRNGAEYLNADEELLVLDGAMEINGVRYTELCYAHLPAGHTRRSASSENGCVAITFVSESPETTAGQGPDDDEERLVEKVDTLGSKVDTSLRELGVDVDDGDGMLDGFKAFSRILYREDPHTHDQTWMLSAPPLWRNDVIEIHPVVEEMYLVTGDLAGDTGLMKAGPTSGVLPANHTVLLGRRPATCCSSAPRAGRCPRTSSPVRTCSTGKRNSNRNCHPNWPSTPLESNPKRHTTSRQVKGRKTPLPPRGQHVLILRMRD